MPGLSVSLRCNARGLAARRSILQERCNSDASQSHSASFVAAVVRGPSRACRRDLRPVAELMESRTLLSIMVNTFDDAVVVDDFTSLREAITQAAATAGADSIDLPAGTYALTLGELAIDDVDALTIHSDGGPATVDAQGASRVFSISAGSDVTLQGLVITGGYSDATGGGVINRGTLAIHESTLLGNTAVFEGGGLDNIGDGFATVTGTVFQDNHSGGYGGGFRNLGVSGNNGSMTVTDCEFIGNTSFYNGGGLDNNGLLVISNSLFEGNHADGLGGAIGNGGTMTLSDSMIRNNTAIGQGGGIFNTFTDETYASVVDISGTTIEGNTSGTGAAGFPRSARRPSPTASSSTTRPPTAAAASTATSARWRSSGPRSRTTRPAGAVAESILPTPLS